jgi:hypothetical protein
MTHVYIPTSCPSSSTLSARPTCGKSLLPPPPPAPATPAHLPPNPARYHDSARCLNTILGYINRVKQFHARSAAYEQILKKNEQMYALLAISCALSPAALKSLDEAVTNQLKEKTAEKMTVRGLDAWMMCARGLCAGEMCAGVMALLHAAR